MRQLKLSRAKKLTRVQTNGNEKVQSVFPLLSVTVYNVNVFKFISPDMIG
jgi:hypothetical protein